MSDEIYDFGIRLKILREKNGLKQSDVARRLGLNPVTIGKYERNLITPSLDVLTSLAILYRTSTDYILNLDKRLTINLDGLTERQRNAVENIVDIVISELKANK